MKTEPTAVIFRTFNGGNDVIALFPLNPADNWGHHCMSYQTTGQHGPATPALMQRHFTRPSTEEEIAPLKAELERIGYSLRVMKRFPRNALDVRKAQVNKWT